MRPKPPKIRADQLIVERGFAPDLPTARALIMAHKALWTDDQGREFKLRTAGEWVAQNGGVRILGQTKRFVSRAGEKLAAALVAFKIDVHDRVCADFGLSTGGFTDCLLQNGAARVHGVDVAYGIVDWSLRTDPRLILHERTNARHLTPKALGEWIDVAVVDVSFISLEQVLPGICAQLSAEATVLALVKPQFELPKGTVHDGVVRDEATKQAAVQKIVRAAAHLGLKCLGELVSPLAGADGNREILLHLHR